MGKHTMTNNPALIEPDRFECKLNKKRRLEAEESNESAALSLLFLKCRSVDTTFSSSRGIAGRNGTGQRRDFQRDPGFYKGMVGNISHDDESTDEDRSHSSSMFGKELNERIPGAKRGCLQLTKLALSHPSILLERSKGAAIVTSASTKKRSSFSSWNCHLPEGRPMPLPPRLPSGILRAPPRNKGVMKMKVAPY